MSWSKWKEANDRGCAQFNYILIICQLLPGRKVVEKIEIHMKWIYVFSYGNFMSKWVSHCCALFPKTPKKWWTAKWKRQKRSKWIEPIIKKILFTKFYSFLDVSVLNKSNSDKINKFKLQNKLILTAMTTTKKIELFDRFPFVFHEKWHSMFHHHFN